MSPLDELKYTLDGRPVSANELISMAESLDDHFHGRTNQTLIEAIQVLRRNGNTVTYNPLYRTET